MSAKHVHDTFNRGCCVISHSNEMFIISSALSVCHFLLKNECNRSECEVLLYWKTLFKARARARVRARAKAKPFPSARWIDERAINDDCVLLYSSVVLLLARSARFSLAITKTPTNGRVRECERARAHSHKC